MKDFGKPGAGESHARFDEGRLETGSGLGQPSLRSGMPGQRRTIHDYRASLLLYC
jgi:hypothetical protein